MQEDKGVNVAESEIDVDCVVLGDGPDYEKRLYVSKDRFDALKAECERLKAELIERATGSDKCGENMQVWPAEEIDQLRTENAELNAQLDHATTVQMYRKNVELTARVAQLEDALKIVDRYFGACDGTWPALKPMENTLREQAEYIVDQALPTPSPATEIEAMRKCERCKDWKRMGLSNTCPSCDQAADRLREARKHEG